MFGKFVTEDVSQANELVLNEFASGPDFESITFDDCVFDYGNIDRHVK